MARLNIEDSLRKDPRFKALQDLVGRQLAWGVWMDAAELAEEYWKQSRKLIPIKLFKFIKHHEALVESQLVELREDGVYLMGSSEFFDWLVGRAEAGQKGGIVSGAKRSKAKQTKVKPNKPKQAEPSYSLSSSSSSFSSSSSSSSIVAAVTAPLGKNLVGHYCDAYKARYDSNPVIRPQDAKTLKSLGESQGVDKLKDLLSAYLEMSNSWFITKSHDIQTFSQNLNQVQNYRANGKTLTRSDATNAEASEALKNQIERLTKGTK